MIPRWKSFKNIRISMSLRITLAHFFSNIDDNIDKARKKVGSSDILRGYSISTLIAGKPVHLFMLTSGGKPACPRYCMVLSFLRIFPFYHC